MTLNMTWDLLAVLDNPNEPAHRFVTGELVHTLRAEKRMMSRIMPRRYCVSIVATDAVTGQQIENEYTSPSPCNLDDLLAQVAHYFLTDMSAEIQQACADGFDVASLICTAEVLR